jgi:hypothetical protein
MDLGMTIQQPAYSHTIDSSTQSYWQNVKNKTFFQAVVIVDEDTVCYDRKSMTRIASQVGASVWFRTRLVSHHLYSRS